MEQKNPAVQSDVKGEMGRISVLGRRKRKSNLERISQKPTVLLYSCRTEDWEESFVNAGEVSE